MLQALRGRPWSNQAACLKEDPELFYAPGTEGVKMSRAAVEQAKAVCAGCPVRDECLTWALDHGETEFGVWGGKTPHERRKERDRRRAAQNPEMV